MKIILVYTTTKFAFNLTFRCKEVISMKSEMQETQEKLVGYEIANGGHYEEAVNNEVHRRLRDISDPLQDAVKTSLDNVLNLVDSITKVKKLVSTLVRIPKERNSSLSNSLHRKSVSSGKSFKRLLLFHFLTCLFVLEFVF